MIKVLCMASSVFLINMSVSAAPSLTQKMLKPVIAYQCQQELKDSKIWRAASWLMTTEQKQSNQASICGCVSDNAMNEMGAKELALALVNEAEKDKLVRKAVMNSLKGCISAAVN
ncbi:hypothetical protein [Acinetobacter sp. B51(2017)]|uniref:hypothetical protein n=1 Tax=Acinetobacter sp. B51(2017) TaxID=2060938 RepID=UPI0013DEF79B|nr:hypothetical protein [Acinetobacter sp. B51(2017)]